MPLTLAHEEKRTLTPEKVEERLRLSFTEVMALDTIERAEVLEALRERDARVRMHANQDEDLPFEMGNPTSHMRTAPALKYVIPGGKKPAQSFPLNAGIYVASHLDQPQFGGSSVREGKPRPDGTVPLQTIPARDDLISFELVIEGV